MTNSERQIFDFLLGTKQDPFFYFENALDFDQQHYLPNDILVKSDRASMFHSLEVRSPFLHPYIYELSLKLDPNLKVNSWKTKEFILQMLRKESKSEVKRPRKIGLGGPVKDWVSKSIVQNSIMASHRNDIVQEAMKFVPEIFKTKIRQGHSQLNWNLAVLQEWTVQRF
jgi:asparagine synthase (glutamine-hydrolysing)